MENDTRYPKRHKIFYQLAFCMLFLLTGQSFANEDPANSTSAPVVNTFELGSDNLGAINNSVNLFTGDVALPINLFSLPGRGLDVSVTLNYSSNVHQSVDVWNQDAPTGILGLGWSMGYETIFVDEKGTGTHHDNDYYLSAGGSTTLLIRTGVEGSARVYKTKNYQFWQVLYYPNDQRWEITKEDGARSIFGGGITTDGNGNKSSDGNSVQWGIKWGNWIGDSNEATSQAQYAIAWNLCKIENVWGDSITFEYTQANNKLGTSGVLDQTEASYLSKITDVFGRYAEFTYTAKESDEYVEPHTEASEPDAYQERYEKVYLDSIVVYNQDDDELFTYDFSYDWLGSGSSKKRLLQTITYKNPDDETRPPLEFAYKSSSPNKGAIETVTYPQGGSVTYVYATKTIINSERDITISAPTSFSEPQVFMLEEYVVVTWYDDGSDVLRVYVYSWDGEWMSNFLVDIPGVNEVSVFQDFGIVLGPDFFAIINEFLEDSNTARLYVFYKDENQRTWRKYESGGVDYFTVSWSGDRGILASGDNFIAVAGREHGTLSRYYREDGVWQSEQVFGHLDGDTNQDYRVSGNNNFFIRHTDNGSDTTNVYYLDEENQWQSETVPSGIIFNSEFANWYCGKAFAVAIAAGNNPEYIYGWDENFTNFFKDNTTIGQVDDNARVFIIGPTVFISGNDVAKGLRWTGQSWEDQDFVTSSGSAGSLGLDFVIRKVWETYDFLKRWSFNPNTLSWSNTTLSSSYVEREDVSTTYDKFTWSQGSVAKVYIRGSSTWDDENVPSWTSEDDKLTVGSNYCLYEDVNGGLIVGTKISYLNNGAWSPVSVLDGQQFTTTVLHNNIITHDGSSIKSSSTLKLYRYANKSVKGYQVDYPVDELQISDGYATTYTSFVYDASTATYDPTGSVAQYNEVQVYPGTNNPTTSKPYGYTTHYFFNGLSNSELPSSAKFPANETNVTNAEDYHNLLKGAKYRTEVYDNTGSNMVGSDESYYFTTTVDFGDAAHLGHYSRVLKTVSMLDDIETVTTFEINSTNGLVEKVIETNSDNSERTTLTTFAYEEYTGMADDHVLSPICQSYVANSTSGFSVRSSSVTTWKDWGSGAWAPVKTYTWIEDDGSYTVPTFDFANWSDSGEPSSGSEWIRSNKILTRDGFGNVKEVQDANGTMTTTKWGFESAVPIAIISNATNSESFNDSFESGDFSGQEVVWGNHGSGTREVTDEDAHTGQYSLKFTKVDAAWSGVYLQSPYIDVVPGEAHTISLWYKCDPARNAYINWYDQTNNKSHTYVQAGTGKWEYLEYTFTAPLADPQPCTKMRVYLYGHYGAPNTPIFYDDIRVYPADALISSTNYDRGTLQVTSTSDENGVTNFFEFDEFNRPVRTRNSGSEILTATAFSDHTFSASDPNFIESVSFPNGNYATNWSFEDPIDTPDDEHEWKSYYEGAIDIVDKSVVQPFLGDYVLAVDDTSSDSDPDGAHFNFYNGEKEFGVEKPNDDEYWSLVGQPVTFSAWVRSASGSKTIRIGIEGNSHQTYSVGTSWQRIWAHMDYLNYEEPSPPEDYVKRLRCNITLDGSQTGAFYIDGVLLEINSSSAPGDFIVSTSYRDGLGRAIQSQSRNGDNDIVNHQVYNELGLVATLYESFEQESNHQFLPRLQLSSRLDDSNSVLF